jgi:hypothetical protein
MSETAAAVEAPKPSRYAKVFLCERGHRTTSIWSTPSVCRARPLRSGPECGRQLYSAGALPEQVLKALNPLKASKKASKKK